MPQPLPSPPFSADHDCPRLSPAALRVAPRIAGKWQLNDHDFAWLLSVPESEAILIRSGNLCHMLTPDELMRVSVMIGIYGSLHTLFADHLADNWIHLPNSGPSFGGLTPTKMMVRDGFAGMMHVRRYLEALCQGY